MARTQIIAALLVGTLALSACANKAPVDLPPTPGGTASAGSGDGGNWGGGNGGAAAQGSQADFIASVSADRIFFDTDRYNIDSADMGVLQSQAQWLGRNPTKSVTIEGHCDERGTRDYNLALGERRANAARNYLMSLGVDGNRIRTVSHGKELPEALGSDEQSWARNRRAVTITVQ